MPRVIEERRWRVHQRAVVSDSGPCAAAIKEEDAVLALISKNFRGSGQKNGPQHKELLARTQRWSVGLVDHRRASAL
jgi:hypothetical protein